MNVLEECINLLKNEEYRKKKRADEEILNDNEEELLDNLRTHLQQIDDPQIISNFEKNVTQLQNITMNNTKFPLYILYEIYIYFLKIETKMISTKAILNQKLLLIIRNPYFSEQLLCNLLILLDRNTNATSTLNQNDQLSLYLYFLEKIFQGHQKNLNEIIKICCRFSGEDKKEYFEGLEILIASDYKENKQQKMKQFNGERIDCVSMLIISMMNRIIVIESDAISQNENDVLEHYNKTIKNLEDFIKNLFKKVLNEGGENVQSYAISAAQSAKIKNESQKIQLFLYSFLNDLSKQLFSAEYSIVPALFNIFISVINTYINNPSFQNNHFIIDLTKSVLKLLYKDTTQIVQFSTDMLFIPCQKAVKGKKSKIVGSVFCSICSEAGFFSLKQNEHVISFCEECANFQSTSSFIPQTKTMLELLNKEPLAFFQTITYYYSDFYHKTQNSNFIDSRSTHILLHFIQQSYNKSNLSSNQNNKNNKISFFLNNLTSQTKFGTSPDSLGSSELDFIDFIYKSKIQSMFFIQDKIEFLLKYIFGLTNDNSSLIRNKSLIILNEIEGFNRSQRFEQYIDIRRRDQQVSVRLTCLKILEELFTSDDQNQYESDDEFRKRKDRYFKMIMDRFNDKETSIRGTVLNFISNNLKSFAQDNQLKISLAKELIIRVLNDTREFQIQSLEILTKIYFPFYQGKSEIKKAVKKVKKQDQKATNLLNIEEEKTLENIMTLQKLFEVNTDILVRIFSHFQEKQSDSSIILNNLLQLSIKLLEDLISNKEERRFVLGVLEVLSKLKNGYEIYKEFQLFISYFELLVNERNQIPLTQKESRAETNLCMITILDIIINMFQRNSFVSTPQIKNLMKQIEDKLLNSIAKEGNVQVLKKMVQLSAHIVNFCSQDIQKILDIFNQRYLFLKNLSDIQNLGQKITNGDQQESEILSFKITMSIYIVSIYAYNFIDGSFKALSLTLQDLMALLLFFLSIKNERIQSASFESISLLWEKEYDLIFSCQDVLSDIILNQATSSKLLIIIYTIFEKYILKHQTQIKQKFNRQVIIKNAMKDENEDDPREEGKDDQEFEHITSVIRDLTIKSYEQSLQNPDLMLKKTVLRLLNVLVSENLVLFQQIGANVISHVCDPDLLTRTLANSIIQEECLRNKDSIDKCLKAGLKKSALFIEQNYKNFTIIEKSDDRCQSLFERINVVLKLKDTADKDTNIFCKRLTQVLEEINDWSYEDHELCYFIIVLIISLNSLSYGDILILLNSLRSISEKLYYDVKDFLKTNINQQMNDFDDEEDERNQRSFIKANILLMCLVTCHVLIIQSNIFTQKLQQIDNFIQRLTILCFKGEKGNDEVDIDEAFEQQNETSTQIKIKLVKKFNGESYILDSISNLFLKEMQEIDCSNQTQLKMLLSKIKNLFYDFIEGDMNKILDLTYIQIDKNAQSSYSNNNINKKNQGQSGGYSISANNMGKNKKQKNEKTKQNVHKAQNKNNSSYHSCKGSTSSHMSDFDESSRTSHKSASSHISENNYNTRLRKKIIRRMSNIQEQQDFSDTDSYHNSGKKNYNEDEDDDDEEYYE